LANLHAVLKEIALTAYRVTLSALVGGFCGFALPAAAYEGLMRITWFAVDTFHCSPPPVYVQYAIIWLPVPLEVYVLVRLLLRNWVAGVAGIIIAVPYTLRGMFFVAMSFYGSGFI